MFLLVHPRQPMGNQRDSAPLAHPVRSECVFFGLNRATVYHRAEHIANTLGRLKSHSDVPGRRRPFGPHERKGGSGPHPRRWSASVWPRPSRRIDRSVHAPSRRETSERTRGSARGVPGSTARPSRYPESERAQFRTVHGSSSAAGDPCFRPGPGHYMLAAISSP